MTLFTELAYPLIQAPMAGGPAQPDLAIQIIKNGGIGFLAAGYKTPQAIETEIHQVTTNISGMLGVNIFIPDIEPLHAEELCRKYQIQLKPLADQLGVDISQIPPYTDDYFHDKVELIADLPVNIVSFTFGLPPAKVIGKLKQKDKMLIATVTSPAEAYAAQELGFDAICLQGYEAGGHSATFVPDSTAPPYRLAELLCFARAKLSTPYIAAGGIAESKQIHKALSWGAAAVQIGTAFLLAEEAGTKPAHRAALKNFHKRKTVITRAYSGREARGIENSFTQKFSSIAPALYPRINTLTQKIRVAAAQDPEIINLWAGENFSQAQSLSAQAIIKFLFK